MEPRGDPVTGIPHKGDINQHKHTGGGSACCQPFRTGSGNEHHYHTHQTHQHNGRQMLLQRQRDQQTQHSTAKSQHTIAKSFGIGTKLLGQPRKQRDHGKFGDFRRLELDAGNIDPALRPVDGLTDHQHAQQQYNTHAIYDPGKAAPNIRRDPAEQPHCHQTQGCANCLFLQIPGTALIPGIKLALGAAGGIEHQQSYTQQQQYQAQKRNIHRFRRSSAPVLFGNQQTSGCHQKLLSILIRFLSQWLRQCRTKQERT